MKKTFAVCCLFFAFRATAQKQNLVTSKSFDKITVTTGYKDLQKLYGAGNVKDDVDFEPEGGDSIVVTKIFPDKKNEIVIYWQEHKFHKFVASVECFQEGAPYYTADSIKLGTTLKKLLSVNGKRIDFSGMDWDYGGAISSLHKGKLEGSAISYSLGGSEGMSSKLEGDVSLNTDMPVVKKNLLKVRVIRITLNFVH